MQEGKDGSTGWGVRRILQMVELEVESEPKQFLEVASGCNVVLFSTGNGSITNHPFVPISLHDDDDDDDDGDNNNNNNKQTNATIPSYYNTLLITQPMIIIIIITTLFPSHT